MSKPEFSYWKVTVTFSNDEWVSVIMTADPEDTAESLLSGDFNFDLPGEDSEGDTDEWHWITNEEEQSGFCFQPSKVLHVVITKVEESDD